MLNELNERAVEFENRLKERRLASRLSQKQLAGMAGMTRQAVCAVEANQYSPATSVALQLALALRCRVEDIFSIKRGGEIVEGELLGAVPNLTKPIRAQLFQVGDRLWVRPMDGSGGITSLAATADGLIVGADATTKRAKVALLKERETVRRQLVIGGCDPAMFLAAERVRKYDNDSLVPCLMGSGMALGALKRGEIHVAGVHLPEDSPDVWNRAALKPSLGSMDCIVITFAHWEEGFIVRHGNPKKIRAVSDIAKPAVRIVNREAGSGARHLLDNQLKTSGIESRRVKGYGDEVLSHLDVAARISAGLADTGVAVRAAAVICGLDFVPLQRERYDLIIPKIYYENVPGLQVLLDTIVSKSFRDEIEALGGYDTRQTGKVVTAAHD
jgi:putative molybdopterin biosynthesis protein